MLFSTASNFGTILEVLRSCHVLCSASPIFCCCRFWKFQLIHKCIKAKRMWFFFSLQDLYFRLTQTLNECLWFMVLFVHVLIIILLLSLTFKNDLMDFSHLRTATSYVKYLFLHIFIIMSEQSSVYRYLRHFYHFGQQCKDFCFSMLIY
jgi:hypothetical protein